MRKRRVIYIAAAITLMGGLVWLAAYPEERGPVYRGRALRKWLTESINTTDPIVRIKDLNTFTSGIEETGTNCIPMLLELLQAHDPPLKAAVFCAGRKATPRKNQAR